MKARRTFPFSLMRNTPSFLHHRPHFPPTPSRLQMAESEKRNPPVLSQLLTAADRQLQTESCHTSGSHSYVHHTEKVGGPLPLSRDSSQLFPTADFLPSVIPPLTFSRRWGENKRAKMSINSPDLMKPPRLTEKYSLLPPPSCRRCFIFHSLLIRRRWRTL